MEERKSVNVERRTSDIETEQSRSTRRGRLVNSQAGRPRYVKRRTLSFQRPTFNAQPSTWLNQPWFGSELVREGLNQPWSDIL